MEADNMTFINNDIVKFLMTDQVKVAVFDVLPKIHKEGTLPLGCPLIVGIGSILQPLAQFLKIFAGFFITSEKTLFDD